MTVTSQAADQDDTELSERAQLRPRLVTALAGVLATIALMVIHGQLPSLVSSQARWFMARGLMECGSLSVGDLAQARCPLIGADGGGSIANGVLFVGVGAAVRRLGVDVDIAYVLTAAAFMGVALWGAFGLGRRVGLGRPVALGVAALYLASPSLVGLHGFGSTFWGVALVPAVVHVSLRAASEILAARWIARVAWAAAWVGAILAMLLLDGYGYVMAQFVAGLLILGTALREWRRARSWLAVVAFLVANGIAFLVYRQIVSGAGDWARSPIDLFRSMGADLATLVIPSPAIWWSDRSPWQVDPGVLWGDGSNATYNYLGLGIVALAVLGVVLARKTAPLVLPLAAITLLALVMSFGPSLKVSEVRGPLEVPVTFDSYLMPADDAVMTLPTQWVYESVPGFSSMRATYRWVAVARLGLLLLAGAGVQALWRRRPEAASRVALVALVGVAVLEASPSYPAMLGRYADNASMAARFEADVLDVMREAVPRGSRVVYAPNAVSENDYLANYLSPMLGVTSYNIGGDKALEDAMARWQPDIRALLFEEEPFASAAAEVLESGKVDMVVIPFFDLRWSATAWPTSEQFREPGLEAAEEAAGDRSLDVQVYEHFAVVTSSGGSTGE